ncbi:MAG: LCP family protein [Anaerolineae bacterium]
MSSNQQVEPQSAIRTALSITYRVVIALIIIGILVMVVQISALWQANMTTTNVSTARQADYAGTATAIAPAGDADAGLYHFVQFATNTPLADQAPPSTQTPEPTAEPPQATEAPAQSTVIPLPTFYAVQDAAGQIIAGTAVPPQSQVVPREDELINIVLLGSDGDIVGDNSIRTDTIVIVSINTRTQTVSMLSIPRDVFVYVPTPTMARINTVYGIGESLGWSGGGFGLLRETIFYNFGIQVHYHAFVEISGLVEIIDTVGGVNIAVDCAYQDPPLIDADVPAGAIGPDEDNVYVLPVGYYQFTGREAMWYARSRGNSDAFDRGRRHIQLLEAILRAGRDNGQLTQIPNLWNDLTQIVETDITLDVVLGLLPIGINLDSSRIERFNLIRTYHTTPWTPNEGIYAGQNVQLLNQQEVFDLMVDFYTPPPETRLSLAGATIAVYNGTDRPDLDIVASERLRNAGLSAIAFGAADEQGVTDTQLTDFAAEARGSASSLIASELNIRQENVTTVADPNRDYDYVVIVGESYNSCNANVLPIE